MPAVCACAQELLESAHAARFTSLLKQTRNKPLKNDLKRVCARSVRVFASAGWDLKSKKTAEKLMDKLVNVHVKKFPNK